MAVQLSSPILVIAVDFPCSLLPPSVSFHFPTLPWSPLYPHRPPGFFSSSLISSGRDLCMCCFLHATPYVTIISFRPSLNRLCRLRAPSACPPVTETLTSDAAQALALPLPKALAFPPLLCIHLFAHRLSPQPEHHFSEGRVSCPFACCYFPASRRRTAHGRLSISRE